MFRERMTSKLGIAAVCSALVAAVLAITPLVRGADDPIDLDGNAANGEESLVRTRVIQTFPVEVENVIFNNAPSRYNIVWAGAGPGGLQTFVAEGPDVGTRWTWTTLEAVFTIESPAVFEPEAVVPADPFGLPLFGMPPAGLTTPPLPPGGGSFVVTGKSQTDTGVTVSSADLLSSLITFFSPPQLIAECGGSFAPGVSETTFTAVEAVTLSAEQDDCCPAAGMIFCDDGCQSYQSDADNCGGCGIICAEGDFCFRGLCRSWCPATKAECGETCVDTDEDPLNCGACGNACDADEICSDSVCTACPAGLAACGSECLDLSDDRFNCGICGNVCQCPNTSGFGSCIAGQCTIDPSNNDCSEEPAARSVFGTGFESDLSRLDSASGRLDATEVPRGRLSRRRAIVVRDDLMVDGSTALQRGEVPVEAPVCTAPPIEDVVLEPGETFTQCVGGGAIVGRQVTRTATIEVDGQTYKGPCPTIVPAPEISVPPFFPHPANISLEDTTGDGMIQPGEPVCIHVSAHNLGGFPFTNPVGVLISPPDENNPLPIVIDDDTSNFESFPAFAGAGDCETPALLESRTNLTKYCFTLPEGHEEDVGRRYTIGFYEEADPANVVNMPFVLGVGRNCGPEDIDGETYDGIEGLANPFNAQLLPENSPVVNFAPSAFGRNKTIPIKLKLACGSQFLGPEDIAINPEIVYLLHEDGTLESLDNINGDDSANPDDTELNCGGQRCEFELRTSQLSIDRYTLGIRMPDGRGFKVGFEIDR